MKEIGDKLKEKREEIGITTKEVADDLKTQEIIVSNIEEGNNKVFKDILELKEFISNYAKYLGLDADELVDEVNDFLFDKTSKISIDDIKEAEKKTVPVERKIKSPYTIEIKERNKTVVVVLIAAVIICVLAIFYIVLRNLFLG